MCDFEHASHAALKKDCAFADMSALDRTQMETVLGLIGFPSGFVGTLVSIIERLGVVPAGSSRYAEDASKDVRDTCSRRTVLAVTLQLTTP